MTFLRKIGEDAHCTGPPSRRRDSRGC